MKAKISMFLNMVVPEKKLWFWFSVSGPKTESRYKIKIIFFCFGTTICQERPRKKTESHLGLISVDLTLREQKVCVSCLFLLVVRSAARPAFWADREGAKRGEAKGGETQAVPEQRPQLPGFSS